MPKNQLSYFIVLVIAILIGCSSEKETGTSTSSSSSGSGATASKGTIAYSALNLTNPFFGIIGDNLTTAAKTAGFDAVVDDAKGDVKTQVEQIESYISRGVAAIVISPRDRLSINPAIQKAHEAGIPVFTTDLMSVVPVKGSEGEDGEPTYEPNPLVVGHVGTDNRQGGVLAGTAMVEVLGETGGKVFILDYPSANSCVLRVEGFMEVINQHNDGRETGQIEIVGKQDGNGDMNVGYTVTAAAIQSNQDLAAIFAINDPSALGGITALTEAGKADQVTVIAFDGQIEGKQAIKDGKIYADPIQFPDQMGRLVVQKIQKYMNGEEFETITLIPTVLYTKADADNDPELK